MQPTITDVHVNAPLTNISIAYIQETENFVADRVFPIIPVNFQSDRYYVYNRDAFFRSDAEERAPGAESAGTGYTIDNTPTYYSRVYGIHDDVPDQVRANSDSVLAPDQDATELVTQQLLIKRETIWANSYFLASPWTGQVTGVTANPGANQFLRWDQAGSKPIEDIQTQITNVAQLTGFRPNVLVLGPFVALQLRNNPEIVDRVKYTQLGFLDLGLLAKAFGVEEVLVPFATQNTALEGTALQMAFIYGKNALLAHRTKTPGLRRPTAGYTFAWKGYLNNSVNVAITKFRMQHLKSDRIEGEMSFDMKVIGPDLGVFFSSCVS